jgi:hypothetical protein
VIKLGVPEGEKEPSEALLDAYLDYYPSDLDDKGRAKSGASSAGEAIEPQSTTGGEQNTAEAEPTKGKEASDE